MKWLQLFLAAGLLTIVMATSALAGEMPYPVTAPQPPSAAGEMPYPVAASIDAVTEIALDLVQSVLALF